MALTEVITQARSFCPQRSWGPANRARLRAVLRDLYRIRLAEIGDLARTYWPGSTRPGQELLRALVLAGVLERLPVVGRCADGRCRRKGYALQLGPAGMALAADELGLPARPAWTNRVPADRRAQQLAVAALYLALLRAGIPAERLLDGREAKLRWGWADWSPVQLALAPAGAEPGLALTWPGRVRPASLQGLLGRLIEQERYGGGSGPGWSLLAVAEGEPPLDDWDPRRVLGSIHLLTSAEALTWGPRLAAGEAGWLPALRKAMAGLGFVGELTRVGPAFPGPAVLRGPGIHAYLADLRGWDPPRLALARQWRPSPALHEPEEFWALGRDRAQVAALARRLAGAALALHLVAAEDGRIWHARGSGVSA